MDIASLSYKIDSTEVATSTDRLRKHESAAKGAASATEKMERSYRDAIKQAKAFGAVLGTIGLALAGAVIKNTIEAEKVQAQLAAVLKSTGGAAGLTRDELNNMAGGLQRVTTYGDEAIGTAQGVLLTFTKIGRETFPRALEATLDLATALNMDLKSASLQVGKALNDPVLGVTALSRAGVQFSEDQKAMIKSLVETGDVASAQTLILAELEKQMGGSARAARDTLGGALTSLQNAFGDLLEGDSGSDGVRGAKSAIEQLTGVLQSSETKQAFASITSAVASLTAELVNGVAMFANYLAKAAELKSLATGGITQSSGYEDIQKRLGAIASRRDELSSQGMFRRMVVGNTPAGFILDAAGEDPGFQAQREARGFGAAYSRTDELDYLNSEFTRLMRLQSQAINRDTANASGGSSGSPNGRGRGFRNIAPLGGTGAATEETAATVDRQTASTRELAAAERELAEQRRLQEQQQQAMAAANETYTRTIEDLRAELGGPMAQVQLEYSRREDELIELARLAGLSQEELASSLDLLEQARLRDVEAIQAQIDAQREWEEAIKNQEVIRGMDDLRMSFEDNLTAVLTFQKSGKEALTDLADTFIAQIARMIAQQASASLFGAPGEMGGGSLGGFFSSLFSAFGGPRALGGDMRGDRFYQVGERDRPELANIGGKQYLIPGDRGNVEPMGGAQMGGGRQVNFGGTTIVVQGATSQRSLDRARVDQRRAMERAAREFG